MGRPFPNPYERGPASKHRPPLAPPNRTWHAHLMHRPGWFVAGFLQVAVGLSILVAALIGTPWFGSSASAGILTFAVAGMAAATSFAPSGDRLAARRVMLVALVPGIAFGIQIALIAQSDNPPHPAHAAGAVLSTFGLLVLMVAEWDRRRVRLRFEGDDLVVSVRRYGLEHRLPLEAVRDVEAHTTTGGRLFRYGTFRARVRKGTMKDRITKPMVGEPAPEFATRGNGWDEEERFLVIAGHPYRRFQRDLEARIRFAKLPPKEREEQELADRLASDLDGIDA